MYVCRHKYNESFISECAAAIYPSLKLFKRLYILKRALLQRALLINAKMWTKAIDYKEAKEITKRQKRKSEDKEQFYNLRIISFFKWMLSLRKWDKWTARIPIIIMRIYCNWVTNNKCHAISKISEKLYKSFLCIFFASLTLYA